MRKLIVCFVVVVLGVGLPVSAAPRFVIDDDEYVDRVTHASAKLLHEGKLLPLATLQGQVRTKRLAVGLSPVSHQSFSTSDLCDRLRESTLAVGTYYKCPDCGGWHFNSSAGFVVAEGGIVCTCCHVVLAEDK